MVESYLNEAMVTCPACGKQFYSSRSAAKHAVRRQKQYGRMSPYLCESGNGYFHIGHLDRKVIDGRLTREERYR